MESYEPKETLVKSEFIAPKEILDKGEVIEGLCQLLLPNGRSL